MTVNEKIAEYTERAFKFGADRAKAEKRLGMEEPDNEPCGEYISQQDIVQHVTNGVLTGPDTEVGFEILDAYENGYFRVWDDEDGEED